MDDKKCIVMLSGGLDSRLVVKIMQEKGFEVIAVYNKLPFSKDVEKEVKEFCKAQKVELKIFDYTKGKLLEEYLDVVKKPCYGYGVSMNPCVDCRIFGLKKAEKFADSKKIKFIATGEVLGQRPMSQLKNSMDLIKRKSCLGERLLRPLADYEIKGRQRKIQIALAKKYKINYPEPAGGCLLCEKIYCKKLKGVLGRKKLNFDEIKLLKIGRHFENSEIILGRNQDENKLLVENKGIKIIPKQPGPTALVRSKEYVEKAKELIRKYSKNNIEEFVIRKCVSNVN